MHWQCYKNIYNEVWFSNTNWKHHPCPFPTASYISSILQCGYQRAHITLVSNSSTGFQLQVFFLPTCLYKMYLLAAKLPSQSFTTFIPLPSWVNFHASSCHCAIYNWILSPKQFFSYSSTNCRSIYEQMTMCLFQRPLNK
jgi:hypothetical protein